MPVLKNAKHETFCQNIAARSKTGWSNTECYLQAGYTAEGNAAEACAARLLSTAKVRARIDELTAPTVRKTRTTVDSLAAQFDAVFDGAMGAAQFGAAGGAAAAKSKLLGFMRDRLEVGGPGDFPDCSTPDDVIDALIVDYNGDARAVVALLGKMLAIAEDRVVAQAQTITALPQPTSRMSSPPPWRRPNA